MSTLIETHTRIRHPDLVRGGEEEVDRYIASCTESFSIFPLLEGIHTGLECIDRGERGVGGRILGTIQEYIQSVGICTKRFYSYERSDGTQAQQRREILAVSDDILRLSKKVTPGIADQQKKGENAAKLRLRIVEETNAVVRKRFEDRLKKVVEQSSFSVFPSQYEQIVDNVLEAVKDPYHSMTTVIRFLNILTARTHTKELIPYLELHTRIFDTMERSLRRHMQVTEEDHDERDHPLWKELTTPENVLELLGELSDKKVVNVPDVMSMKRGGVSLKDVFTTGDNFEEFCHRFLTYLTYLPKGDLFYAYLKQTLAFTFPSHMNIPESEISSFFRYSAFSQDLFFFQVWMMDKVLVPSLYRSPDIEDAVVEKGMRGYFLSDSEREEKPADADPEFDRLFADLYAGLPIDCSLQVLPVIFQTALMGSFIYQRFHPEANRGDTAYSGRFPLNTLVDLYDQVRDPHRLSILIDVLNHRVIHEHLPHLTDDLRRRFAAVGREDDMRNFIKGIENMYSIDYEKELAKHFAEHLISALGRNFLEEAKKRETALQRLNQKWWEEARSGFHAKSNLAPGRSYFYAFTRKDDFAKMMDFQWVILRSGKSQDSPLSFFIEARDRTGILGKIDKDGYVVELSLKFSGEHTPLTAAVGHVVISALRSLVEREIEVRSHPKATHSGFHRVTIDDVRDGTAFDKVQDHTLRTPLHRTVTQAPTVIWTVVPINTLVPTPLPTIPPPATDDGKGDLRVRYAP